MVSAARCRGGALAYGCLLCLRADVEALQCLHEGVQGRTRVSDGQQVPSFREQLDGFTCLVSNWLCMHARTDGASVWNVVQCTLPLFCTAAPGAALADGHFIWHQRARRCVCKLQTGLHA